MESARAQPPALPAPSTRRAPSRRHKEKQREGDAQAQRDEGDSTRRVHVIGFPAYTEQVDIVRVFTQFGPVTVDRMNNRYALLSFPSPAQALAATQASKKVTVYGAFLSVTPYTANLKPQALPPLKREFPRSKQKGMIVEPQCIDLSGDFHQQLDRVLATVRLNQEEALAISMLYEDLQRVLQSQWPGCVAMPFGSITTGLGIKTSDADCFVHIPQRFQHAQASFVNKAKRILQLYPLIFAEILSIPRANTPIVKFFHIPTETNCDLSFKTPLGTQNSELISFLLHTDSRLIPMAVAIKYWAKVHGLSGTGKLTNYALTMMIIFYLQQPPISVLPPVEMLQRDRSYDVIVDHWNTGFMNKREALPPSQHKSTIAQFLGGFFEYYAAFNFEEMVVCPYLGTPIKKELFRTMNELPRCFERYIENVLSGISLPMRFMTSICVQDPFEQSHNVASAITPKLAAELKAYIKFAAEAYEKGKKNECVDFLKTILLQQPKIIAAKYHPEYRYGLFPKYTADIVDPDWKAVVRKTILTMFQTILKLECTKCEEKLNPESKRDKERYSVTMTKAIWKRKQFSKLYNLMSLPFLDKQTKITEEIISADKNSINVQFQLTMTFGREVRNASVNIKLIDGDMDAFKEFGKFFASNAQNWITTLLKPFVKKKASITKVNVNINKSGVESAEQKETPQGSNNVQKAVHNNVEAESVKDAHNDDAKVDTHVENDSVKVDTRVKNVTVQKNDAVNVETHIENETVQENDTAKVDIHVENKTVQKNDAVHVNAHVESDVLATDNVNGSQIVVNDTVNCNRCEEKIIVEAEFSEDNVTAEDNHSVDNNNDCVKDVDIEEVSVDEDGVLVVKSDNNDANKNNNYSSYSEVKCVIDKGHTVTSTVTNEN